MTAKIRNALRYLLPPFILDAFRWVRYRGSQQRKKDPGKVIIGNYELASPPGYGGPLFKNTFRLYDCFLPVLVKHINQTDTVVDVGANIGDTTMALVQMCSNPIISVEPSDLFHPYLKINVNKLPLDDRSRVLLVKKLIGTGVIKGELLHENWGTASVSVSDRPSPPTHTALDEVIPASTNVVLLKTDTDGFDYDVMRSAERIILTSKPILFWENEISEQYQQDGFNELYGWLEGQGYTHVSIFDNFGNLMVEDASFKTLKDMNSYVYSMQVCGCTRTLYYTDVLACTEKNRVAVVKAIAEYREKHIYRT